MRLTKDFILRITPEIRSFLDMIPDGKRASVTRTSLEMYFKMGHVCYEVFYVSRNVKYFGIAETRDYFDCDNFIFKLAKRDVEIAKELTIHPMSEFEIRVVGVYPRLEECIRYRDWLVNDWVNSGGTVYNAYEVGFKRTFQISVSPDESERLIDHCIASGRTIQKIVTALMKKYLKTI